MSTNVDSGTYVGNGAAINISLGWVPDEVKVWNDTDGDESWTWYSGMANAAAQKIAADGTQTKITANGVTPYAGSGTAPMGFTVGTALSENGKTFRWTALRKTP